MLFCVPRFSRQRVMMLPRYCGRGDHGGRDEGLLGLLDLGRVGEVRRVVDEDHLAALERDPVLHRRRGEDDGHLELALQPLLDDLQVQQAEEAAAEPVAEGHGGILLVDEGGVVELQLGHGLRQAPRSRWRPPGRSRKRPPASPRGSRQGAAAQGLSLSVTVSPTRVSATVLIPAMR